MVYHTSALVRNKVQISLQLVMVFERSTLLLSLKKLTLVNLIV